MFQFFSLQPSCFGFWPVVPLFVPFFPCFLFFFCSCFLIVYALVVSFSCFFCFTEQSSVRVERLDASSIIATSGNPAAEREMTITCHVPPGHYTILCSTYKSGDEGPFRLQIHSNWPVGHSQLWPPAWKKQGLAGPKQSMKEKLVAAAKAKAEAAANTAKNSVAKAKASAKAKVMQHTDWVDEAKEKEKLEKEREDKNLAASRADKAEDPNEIKLRAAKELKRNWKEKQSSDGVYWYNKTTSVSTYDKPEGFLNKREIKMLELEVDQERTRRRVEKMSRRGAAGNSSSGGKGGDSSDDD